MKNWSIFIKQRTHFKIHEPSHFKRHIMLQIFFMAAWYSNQGFRNRWNNSYLPTVLHPAGQSHISGLSPYPARIQELSRISNCTLHVPHNVQNFTKTQSQPVLDGTFTSYSKISNLRCCIIVINRLTFSLLLDLSPF